MTVEQWIIIITAFLGASGLWNALFSWLTNRSKNKKMSAALEAADGAMKAQAAMQRAMDAQEKTVSFLRQRLDALDREQQAEDERHSKEMKEAEERYQTQMQEIEKRYQAKIAEYEIQIKAIECRYQAQVAEITRQANVAKVQFADCQKLLHAKADQVDSLQSRLNSLADELDGVKQRIDTKPLRPKSLGD